MTQELSTFIPFDLADNDAYRRWRDDKLAAFPSNISELFVEVETLGKPSESERAALIGRCLRSNMAIYASSRREAEGSTIRQELRSFARALGLRRIEGHRSAADDGIVAIEVARDGKRKGYIPYSDKPLSWHTDGYYNSEFSRVRSFLLHCVRDAAEGGETEMLDPEIAYIRLRDENPDFVAALMQKNTMTIPANVEDGGKVRPECTGPVFSIDPTTGKLHMRYTARGRNVEWCKSEETQAAVRFLAELLNGGDPLIFRHKLAPGQGLICSNILHRRTSFRDYSESDRGRSRLLYRVRYLDEISAPGIASCCARVV